MRVFIIMVFLASAFLAVNCGFNFFVAIIASGSSFILIFLLNYFSKDKSIESITLGKKGFTIVTIYVIFLNVFMFFILLPENIPISWIPITIIIAAYAIVIIILKVSPPVENIPQFEKSEEELMNKKKIYTFIGIFIILSALYCFIPIIAIVLFAVFTFGLLIIGPILFVYLTKKAIKGE